MISLKEMEMQSVSKGAAASAKARRDMEKWLAKYPTIYINGWAGSHTVWLKCKQHAEWERCAQKRDITRQERNPCPHCRRES